MATATSYITAEQYLHLADTGSPTELVRGEVHIMNPPYARHGQVCSQTCYVLRCFVDPRRLGHVLTNDSGVITERNPDTVRGADVAYYSFAKLPPGPIPGGYVAVPPDAVFEVLSPSDRWDEVLRKVSEYLKVGVKEVVVLDPEEYLAHLYVLDKAGVSFTREQELPLPAIAADCAFLVQRFFE